MSFVARWGTQVELDTAGTLRDRSGDVVARLEGERAWLRAAPGRELGIEPAPAAHPIFGPCAQLLSAGRACSLMGAVDWRAPRSIPPVAEPARLPPLTGTAVLNLLAHCALAAGISRLRYVGPYPSAALYASLRQAFVPLGDEAAFTAEGAALLLAPRMATAPVELVPAPFERWWLTPSIGVQARAEIERVFVDDASFERSPTAMRRLTLRPAAERAGADPADLLAAELWFGDTRWATVVELGLDGSLRRGPLPLPAIADPIVGRELPTALRRALASLIAETVPGVLAPLVEPILAAATLRWGDAGLHAVRADPGAVILHAGLWLSLRDHGAARLALAIAEALTPWVVSESVRRATPA